MYIVGDGNLRQFYKIAIVQKSIVKRIDKIICIQVFKKFKKFIALVFLEQSFFGIQFLHLQIYKIYI